jgi:cytochrome c-type biogenesis protein CcmH
MILFLTISTLITIISIGILLFKGIGIKKVHAIALVIATPILLVVIYLQIGSPNTFLELPNQGIATQHTTSNSPVNTLNNLDPEQVKFAISKLKEKIEKDPNDINSLNLLSNSYLLLEQHSNAVATLDKLISLGQNDIETLLKTINSYNFAEQGRINERAHQLIQTILSQAPNHPQGLWIAGMSEMQRNNIVKAKEHWNHLIPVLEGTPQQQELINIVAQLGNENIESNQPTEKQPEEQSDLKINVVVSLTNNFDISKTDPNDTVFVFATAKNGPPAPLAVKRLTVADLPATITLTEQDAMLPQMNISKFDDIILSAKISKTGNPTDKTGDINSQVISLNMSQLEKEYKLNIE